MVIKRLGRIGEGRWTGVLDKLRSEYYGNTIISVINAIVSNSTYRLIYEQTVPVIKIHLLTKFLK